MLFYNFAKIASENGTSLDSTLCSYISLLSLLLLLSKVGNNSKLKNNFFLEHTITTGTHYHEHYEI